MKKIAILGILLACFIVLSSTSVMALEEDDLAIYGLEVEKLLNLASGVLATVLAVLTLFARKRTHNKRLDYVCAAFFIFAIKAFLMGSEIFLGEFPYIDPITVISDFVILITFFLGMLKK